MASKIIADEYVNRFKEIVKKEKDFLDIRLTKDSNVGVYQQAIYLGYLDAARTFSNQKRLSKKDESVTKVAATMKTYVDNDGDFDKHFYKICRDLCSDYEMKFGQAQKIINMAYKYLYCIADEELKNNFCNCHMPLDGIMLEWIHRNITDGDGKKLKKADAWSTMAVGDDNTPCTYKYYKKHIDAYCEQKDKTPLQLDFENWVVMSQTIAMEDYLKTFTIKELEQGKQITLLQERKDQNVNN